MLASGIDHNGGPFESCGGSKHMKSIKSYVNGEGSAKPTGGKLSIAMLSIATLTLAACGSSSSSSSASTTAPSASSSGSSSTPGVTSTSILFGQTIPKSGPAALYGEATAGVLAYFDMVNAAGGVNGRKLKLDSLDDQYQPPVALQDTKQLIQQDHVFAIVDPNGTATTQANLPVYEANSIPVVGPMTGASTFYDTTRPFYFNVWPAYTLEGKTIGGFLQKSIKPTKLGVIYQNDDFGKSLLSGLTSTGVSAAVSIPYDPTQTDFSADAEKLKSAGVTAVVLFAIPGPTIKILNAFASINYDPKIIMSQVALTPTSYSAAGPAVNGSYITGFIPPIANDAGNPQVAEFKSAMAKYQPNAPANVFAGWGWEAAQAAVAGLKAVKGPLTRPSYISALNSLQNLQLLGGTVSYSPSDHNGITTVHIYQNQNGHRIAVPGF